MDQELKAYLDERFGQIDRRFGQIEARLGQIDERFGQIEARLGQIGARFGEIDRRFEEVYKRIDAVQAGMFQRMDEMAASLEEQFRTQQTEVLKAAFTMQESVGMRLRDQENGVAAVRERMTNIERRLFEIEKRLLMPPTQ